MRVWTGQAEPQSCLPLHTAPFLCPPSPPPPIHHHGTDITVAHGHAQPYTFGHMFSCYWSMCRHGNKLFAGQAQPRQATPSPGPATVRHNSGAESGGRGIVSSWTDNPLMPQKQIPHERRNALEGGEGAPQRPAYAQVPASMVFVTNSNPPPPPQTALANSSNSGGFGGRL